MKNKVKQVGRMCYGILFKSNGGWDKSPSLSIIFGLSIKTQWLSGLYSADFISFYSPTQLCGGGTTKSNSNELPISVPLSFIFSVDLLATIFHRGDSRLHGALSGSDNRARIGAI